MGKTEDIPYFGYLSNAALSDVGRKRKNNEDNYGAFADYGLFCVADGMGGASDGEVASRIVVEHLSATIKNWKKFKRPIPLEDRLALVDKTLDAASAWINQYADSHEARGCGTTFVGVVLDPADATKAVAMHAGDSRLYLIHKKKISQITNDHSVANMTGIKNEADLDPVFRNMILRAVGIKPTVELERTPFRISEGDSILICSDGLTKMLSDKQILKIILETQNCHKGVRLLIDEANRLGGKDNVTAILVNITYIPPVREVHSRLSEEEFLSCLRNAETDACATTESAFTMPTTATSSTYDDFSDSTQRDDTWLDNDSDDVISGTLEQQSTKEAVEGEVQKTHIPEQVNGKAEDVCSYQSQVEGLSGDCNLKKGIRNTGNNNHISVTKKKNLIVCSIISILILVIGIFAIYNIKHNKEIARQVFNSNVKAIIAKLESLKSEIESAETLNGYSNEILSAASSFENEIRKAKLNSLSEEDFQESIASFRLATNGLVKAVNERQEQIAVEEMALKKKLADATVAFDRTLARAKDNLNKLRSSIASSEKLDGIKTNLEAIKSEVKQAEHLANDAGVPTEERLKEAGVNRLFADIEDEIESREKVLAAEAEMMAGMKFKFINDSWEEGGHVVWSNSTIQIRDKPDIISKSSLSETKENSNYIAFWGTRENETQPRFLHVISLPLSQINGHIACIKLSHTNCLDITHLDEYINAFKENSNNTKFYSNCTRKCNEKWKDMKEISNAMLKSHEKLKKVVLDYIWLVKFLMEKNQEFDFKKVDFENWEKSVNVDNK